jgi:hypothetical protein
VIFAHVCDIFLGYGYEFGASEADATVFGITQGALDNADGCTNQNHMDSINFRDAGDGYGWSAAVVTNKDYYFDFGGIVDFISMDLTYGDEFYDTFYGTNTNSEAILAKFPYIDFRYRFNVSLFVHLRVFRDVTRSYLA